jgi:RNA polymerase sigma factor for flagellar operon FliA
MADTRTSLEQLFLGNLGLIEGIVRQIARRHALSAAEAEDLLSAVRLKLIENAYQILGEFEGRSALATYLTVVITRLFLDERIKAWGKWRPTAAARRLGPLAVRLEALLSRDGLTFEEASARLVAAGSTPAELEEIHARLPVRRARVRVVAGLPDHFSEPRTVDDAEASLERREIRQRARGVLARATATLSTDDRLLVRMRFADNLPARQVAKVFGIDEKAVYRRVESVCQRLRRLIEGEGLTWDEVSVVIGREDDEE